jgi:hypothetical protein
MRNVWCAAPDRGHKRKRKQFVEGAEVAASALVGGKTKNSELTKFMAAHDQLWPGEWVGVKLVMDRNLEAGK